METVERCERIGMRATFNYIGKYNLYIRNTHFSADGRNIGDYTLKVLYIGRHVKEAVQRLYIILHIITWPKKLNT